MPGILPLAALTAPNTARMFQRAAFGWTQVRAASPPLAALTWTASIHCTTGERLAQRTLRPLALRAACRSYMCVCGVAALSSAFDRKRCYRYAPTMPAAAEDEEEELPYCRGGLVTWPIFFSTAEQVEPRAEQASRCVWVYGLMWCRTVWVSACLALCKTYLFVPC